MPELSLPSPFLTRMERLLGEEYPAFLESYKKPRTYGLRINPLKISRDDWEKISPFGRERIPWTENGYFYKEEDRPARHPFYQAGLYYLQEPSAMTPASRLPVMPGERVLDLCAAPGGKATALGAALQGKGLLVANDISASRARALLRNLELFGVTNALVLNETPAALSLRFPSYFHKILLDAPCSGEGMFRKEDALVRDWSPEKSEELSRIQKELILQAADMLRPGGMLLYSTCTFAPAEDEDVIAFLLENRPDLHLAEVEGYQGFAPGFVQGLEKCVRIFPHRMEGEGHFLALLKKDGPAMQSHEDEPSSAEFDDSFGYAAAGDARRSGKAAVSGRPGKKKKAAPAPGRPSKEAMDLLSAFFREIGLASLGGAPFDQKRVAEFGERLYYLPDVPVDTRGLTFLRHGLYLGDLRKNRFEPSQPLALALHKGDVSAVVSLPASDERIAAYLRGEPVPVNGGEAASSKGWQVLAAEGYPLAFGKMVNGTLKNKYPAGWRIN